VADIERLFNVIKPIVMRVRRSDSAVKQGGKPPRWTNRPITRDAIMRHLNGGPSIGACPIEQGESTTRIAVFDIDDHEGALDWEHIKTTVANICEELTRRGYMPTAFRSAGGKGAHIYVMWSEPQDAYSVRQEMRDVLAQLDLHDGAGGISRLQVEVFPKQDKVPVDGKGNMFILPLARKSRMLDAGYEPIELEDTTEFDVHLSQPVPVRHKPEIRILDPDDPNISVDGRELENILRHISNEEDPVHGTHSLSYDEWRNVIFAIHDATGGSDEGLALAQHWSAQSEKYTAGFLEERVWPYIHSDRGTKVTAATLIHLARKEGYQEYTGEQALEDLSSIPTPSERADERDDNLPISEVERFTPLSIKQFIKRPAPRWLITNLIPERGLILSYGESGSGKSYVALDRGMAMAQGIQWFGYKTPRALKVVYVVAEGAGGFRNRVKVYCDKRRVDDDAQFYIVDAAPDLRSKEDLKSLATKLKELSDRIGGIDYIIFDTLAQCTPGANENSAEDMGLALNRVRVLQRLFKCAVELVHHAGKDATKGARGWSGIFAAADVVIEHRILTPTLRECCVLKQKDGEAGAAHSYMLEAHLVEVLEDGVQINSCIVIPKQRGAEGARPLIGRVTGLWPNRVYRIACSMADLGDGIILTEALIDNVVDNSPVDPKASGRDRRREQVTRALDGMVEKGIFEYLGNNRLRFAGLTV